MINMHWLLEVRGWRTSTYYLNGSFGNTSRICLVFGTIYIARGTNIEVLWCKQYKTTTSTITSGKKQKPNV